MDGLFLSEETTMSDEERIRECQAEIKRLRQAVREYSAVFEKARTIDYGKLLELWSGFDDSAAADEVNDFIERNEMGTVDAISLIAFCYGYELAMQKIREGL
jgi:hypothetical protein